VGITIFLRPSGYTVSSQIEEQPSLFLCSQTSMVPIEDSRAFPPFSSTPSTASMKAPERRSVSLSLLYLENECRIPLRSYTTNVPGVGTLFPAVRI